MAASLHGDTPYSGKAVTSGSVTPYTTSVDVNWMARDTKHGERWDGPPDIWSGISQDDVLLHPTVQAVMIWCEAREA